jgi:sugar O-acyltransferase (sialic acid O-acetyltransferase NeuD family)
MGLVLLGSGGHAKSCRDVVESFVDYSISLSGKIQIGVTIPDTRHVTDTGWKSLCENYDGFILGVGQIHSPKNRIAIVETLKKHGGKVVTLISPYARVSPSAKVGAGTVVMPNASINAGAEVGPFCIINTGAIIEHDSRVHEYCHISTGAVVNGDCGVGRRCFIGSNAVLLNQMDVCSDVTVGAGSVVTRRITEPGGIYVGNPAKFLKYKS